MLKKLGVGKGDKVGIYLPMIPELPIIMLACARIGATFTAVFSGFTAQALADRMNDLEAKVLVTADGGWRRGSPFPLKKVADEAMKLWRPTVKKQIVVKRTGVDVEMADGRDFWWHDLMKDADGLRRAGAGRGEPPPVHPLHFRHHRQAQGRRPLHRRLHGVWQLDLQVGVQRRRERRLLVHRRHRLGHRPHLHRLRAALRYGSTSVMYEGAPNFPDLGRWWDIIEKYGVNVLYTSPTAIRMFRQAGEEWLEKSRPEQPQAAGLRR